MKILLLGSLGSGKSTQAQILSEQLGFRLVRSGDLVRELAKKNSQDGKACQEALKSGHLAPDKIVSKLVSKKVKESKTKRGFIFDGYIRRLSQLKYFDPKYDLVIHLKLPESEVLSRLQKRGRADDKAEIISERLKVYNTETEPLVEFYKAKKLLKIVDATGDIDQVTNRFKEQIQNER